MKSIEELIQSYFNSCEDFNYNDGEIEKVTKLAQEILRRFAELEKENERLKKKVEDITELVCRSAPVTWASAEWIEEASKFEKELCLLLNIGCQTE
jgi:hypothetical protein